MVVLASRPCPYRRPSSWPAAGRLSRRFQWLGALDPFAIARRMQRVPQIGPPLHIQPEISAVAEHPSKNERRRSSDAAPASTELIDVLALHPHGLGQRALRQTHRFHELLDQDLANA